MRPQLLLLYLFISIRSFNIWLNYIADNFWFTVDREYCLYRAQNLNFHVELGLPFRKGVIPNFHQETNRFLHRMTWFIFLSKVKFPDSICRHAFTFISIGPLFHTIAFSQIHKTPHAQLCLFWKLVSNRQLRFELIPHKIPRRKQYLTSLNNSPLSKPSKS